MYATSIEIDASLLVSMIFYDDMPVDQSVFMTTCR